MINRLLADADFNVSILSGVLRGNSDIDFKKATEVPLAGLKDPMVLTVAASEGRVLVSHDRRTMRGHLRDFIAVGPSPGVILVPQDMGIGEAIENLLLICDSYDPDALRNKICQAENFHIYGF